MSKRHSQGFTLIEFLILLFSVAIIALMITIMSAVLAGNFWFTEEGVLKKAQIHDKSLNSVIDVNRSVFSYSSVVLEDNEGNTRTFQVETNILFNCNVQEVK